MLTIRTCATFPYYCTIMYRMGNQSSQCKAHNANTMNLGGMVPNNYSATSERVSPVSLFKYSYDDNSLVKPLIESSLYTHNSTATQSSVNSNAGTTYILHHIDT